MSHSNLYTEGIEQKRNFCYNKFIGNFSYSKYIIVIFLCCLRGYTTFIPDEKVLSSKEKLKGKNNFKGKKKGKKFVCVQMHRSAFLEPSCYTL